jgi:hypothetical protein
MIIYMQARDEPGDATPESKPAHAAPTAAEKPPRMQKPTPATGPKKP